jgi:hypothetical protein
MPNPSTEAAAKPAPDTPLTPDQLAARWSMSRLTLEVWRQKRKGPPWIRLGSGKGSGVRYRLNDIEAYEQANRQEAGA